MKCDWEQELTNCSIELIKLLVAQYRLDLISLDQELISLQTKHESVKSHIQFEKKWQELKEYLNKLNKDIISKKQTKMYRDKMAFLEGYAYCWNLMPHNRRSGQGSRSMGSAQFSREEDTGSDFSLSSSSTRPTPTPTTPARFNPNLGARKRGFKGSHPFTPHPKKRSDDTSKRPPYSSKHQHEQSQSGPNVSGPLAAQPTTHLGPFSSPGLESAP